MDTLWELITLPFQALECMISCFVLALIFACIAGIVFLMVL